jgi:hypothetical protein
MHSGHSHPRRSNAQYPPQVDTFTYGNRRARIGWERKQRAPFVLISYWLLHVSPFTKRCVFSSPTLVADYGKADDPRTVKTLFPYGLAINVSREKRLILSKQHFLLTISLSKKEHCLSQFSPAIPYVQTYFHPVDLSIGNSDRRIRNQIILLRRTRLVWGNEQGKDRKKPKPGKKKPEPKPEEKKPKPGREGSREPREPRGPNAKAVRPSPSGLVIVLG